jgi:hypothetical protein
MILQNILHQNSEKVWNIRSQSCHGRLKYFRRHQTPDQIAEREKSDAALQVLALCNVRAKLRSKTQQEYLLPQKKPPQPNYLKSWVDTARNRPAFKTFQNRNANSDGRNVEAEFPNAFLTQNPQTIQNILRSVFANAAEVMIAFNSAEDGFLTVFDLIQGFKKLGVHQFSILQALKDIKFYMKDGRMRALHFLNFFHWVCASQRESQ